jgi:tetratricopeptide (TPR) repeat protein
VGDLLYFNVGPRLGMRRGVAATAWYERGCALELGDPVAAIAAYERALAGCPDLADAHCNLGRLLHDDADLASAEGHYRLAICSEPGVALYWFNLGVVLEDQGRNAEAMAAYQQALACGHFSAGERAGGGPETCIADAHWNLARLLESAGRAANDDEAIRSAVRHLLAYRSQTRVYC